MEHWRPGHGVRLQDTLLTPPLPSGGLQEGVRSIMKRKEEAAEPEDHQQSLQCVGVNGG